MESPQSLGRGRAWAHWLLLLGVVSVGVAPIVWYFLPPAQAPGPPPAATAPALEQGVQPSSGPLERHAAGAADSPSRTPGVCALDAIVPPAGARDGLARAEHPFPGGPRTKVKVFVRAAESAAAGLRPRDAEVALIAACGQAEQLTPSPNIVLARVLARLGDHYAAVARLEQDVLLRSDLVARARLLRTHSADAYASTLGPNAAATRRARRELLELDKALASVDVDPDDMAAGVAVRARQARGQAAAAQPSARPQPRVMEPAAEVPPSRAKSAIGDSPEFRQLDSDLARLRRQAEAVSDDPAGLRMRADAALGRKDNCEDAACLRDWYAARRRELLAEF